jgi:hypothetical protein
LLRAYGWRESWHQSRGYLSSRTSLPDLPRTIPKLPGAKRAVRVLFRGTPERAAELVQRADNGVPKAVLALGYGISPETVYQYLRHAKVV